MMGAKGQHIAAVMWPTGNHMCATPGEWHPVRGPIKAKSNPSGCLARASCQRRVKPKEA
jgi:hypothetical protein